MRADQWDAHVVWATKRWIETNAPGHQWREAIDHELSSMDKTVDDFSSPQEAIKALMDWSAHLATDPAVNGGQALMEAEPVHFARHRGKSDWQMSSLGRIECLKERNDPDAPKWEFLTLYRKAWDESKGHCDES